jgi:Ca2+-binding RTX toxin-like protein
VAVDNEYVYWTNHGTNTIGRATLKGRQVNQGFITLPPSNLYALAIDAETGACAGQEATIVGTDRPDELRGTNGDDVIAAGGGDDTVVGLRGDDIVCGAGGDDALRGKGGDDELRGGRGDDELRGGGGGNRCRGGRGSDSTHSC